MKNNYFYYACYKETESGLPAFPLRVHECNNLVAVFQRFHGLKYVTPCATLKEAQRIVDLWNKKEC